MKMTETTITRRTLLGGVAVTALSMALPFQASTAFAQELPEAQGDVDMAEVLKPGPLPEMAIGDENAPVTIVEYMSMTCPHCATFHNNTFEEIKTKYVDTGKARFIIREFPFDPRAAAAFMLARCSEDPVPPPNVEGPVNRCEADLTPFLSKVGSGASARRIESADQLIGGEAAQGRIGDLMLENDKIRVIIQGPDRHIQPNPYGGQIIDADIRRDGPGRDAFGKIAPLYAFGRTQKATSVDVYRDRDGRAGGRLIPHDR